ncbi:MAG: DUF222 domain-containing protein [Actinomycetes bacterium]
MLVRRLASWVESVELAVLAEFARRPEVEHRDPAVGRAMRARPGRCVRAFAGDEVAARLGMTVPAAEARVALAAALAGTLPETRAALASGLIDGARARVVADETVRLEPAQAAVVEHRVLARGGRSTPQRLRQAVRRAVLGVDPHAARERCARARADRDARVCPGGDGVALVLSSQPVEHAGAIDAVLRAAASALARVQGETRTVDQLRADALAAPFLEALRTGVLDGLPGVALGTRDRPPVAVRVTVPVGVLLGTSEAPAEIAGLGPVSADFARALAQGNLGRATVLRTDPSTGEVLADGAGLLLGHVPPPSLARAVCARDVRCRFPGCERRAEGCDLDHTEPWPAGPTAAGNLGPLCRRHHRLKQRSGFRLRQVGPGRFRWTFPTGHSYDVGPPDVGGATDQGP